MKLAPNDNYFTEEQHIYTYTHTYTYIKVINRFEKKNFFVINVPVLYPLVPALFI